MANLPSLTMIEDWRTPILLQVGRLGEFKFPCKTCFDN